MIRYLRGWLLLELTGAEPLCAVNLFLKKRLAVWKVERKDELTLLCRIRKKDLPLAQKYACAAMCSAQVVQEHSAMRTFGGLRRRPVLLAGTVLAVLLAMFLQNFVWTVEIEGNREIPTELLRQQLEEVGVRFGAWAPSFEPVLQRFAMQGRIGKIAWLAVNRRGGKVTVSLTEREKEAEDLDRRVFTNLVAACPGILTTVDVYNGFTELKTGDAVVTGQLLVSGIADWETHTQVTRALGEIFAQTLHQQTFCLPAVTAEKHYTGREFRQVSLVLGRKRIKIFGNSGISYPSCDKMTHRSICTLPGGYTFPLVLETAVYKEYTLKTVQLPKDAAKETLTAYALDYVQERMLAGQILSHTEALQTENGAYMLDVSAFCEEMIARTRPGELKEEDEDTNGTDDQRGTN